MGEIVLPKKEQGQVTFQLGARITAGRGVFHKTKIVTLTPRFVVNNELELPLELEECDEQGRALTDKSEKETFHASVASGNNVLFFFFFLNLIIIIYY